MSSSARERLYHASLLNIYAQRGTPYPCSQRDINATEQFSHHNERPFVSASRASREIIEHNDQRRSPSSCEQDAIRCLARALDEAESGPWGPDLIIKCFCDLDIVFFGGVLRGNVRVGWGSAHELAMLEEALRDNYGITIHTQPGRADIFLNARGIFSNPNAAVSLFRAIFSTMLHEMCHAFEFVRVRPDEHERDGHGPQFGSRIHAVDRRANELLGLEAVEAWEFYRRCHTGGRAVDSEGRRGFRV